MSRGDVWLVNLDPVVGSEANTVRPALIVGRNTFVWHALESGRAMVTVVPITSQVENVYDFQVLIDAGTGGLERPSKAQAEQIRSISPRRLVRRLGAVPERVSDRVDDAIRLYLGL